MIYLYIIAIIPLLIGGVLYATRKEIALWEWLVPSLGGLLVCAIFQYSAVAAMTTDTECWSGQIGQARFDPSYVEWYMQAHTRTVGSGKNQRTEVYYTRETRRVSDRWSATDNIGGGQSIPASRYADIETMLGKADQRKGMKHNFDSGNPYTYVVTNKTGYVYPVTSIHRWSNRVKAAPSVFSFQKIPEGTKGLHEWPASNNWFSPSMRLLGTATDLGVLPWDQMNALAGYRMHANVIAIGFGEQADSKIAHLQEAKWVGGKKNDLVICYGGGTRQQPAWTYCFGWTESELVKRNLETLFLNGPVSSNLVPQVQEEVRKNFKPKDWRKFDYITIEVPGWAYLILVGVTLGSQLAWWFFAFSNDADKTGIRTGYHRLRYGR